MAAPPIVWSIAGNDSGGGAGLAADLRAADAFGVHGCAAVAAITAQHSRSVLRVDAVAPELLQAQLAALADDLPPRVIKTGVLGSAANVQVVARWVDRLRAQGPLALVIDPVLRASSGDALAGRELVAALRGELLPRADLVTPNRHEAAALLGRHDPAPDDLPELGRAWMASGAGAVCITGGDGRAAADAGAAHDWLQTPQASGWLSGPRHATRHSHGTGCAFASAAAAALAHGFVSADALVLARMALAHALRHDAAGVPPGPGPGPVRLRAGFAGDASALPVLGPEPEASPPAADARQPDAAGRAGPPELYAIVDSAERVQAVLAAGVRLVQLRIKQARPDDRLRAELARAITMARQAGARLVVNDHWALAIELGAWGVHLGQEDLQALDRGERALLRDAQARGLALGISSHSLWELCRAAAWRPHHIACGPVWPTATKAMPWRAQGMHNLAWWCAVAPAPVVAIGGILCADRAAAAARCGAAAICIVRGLGDEPAGTVPAFTAAIAHGRAAPPEPCPPLPRPSLDTAPAGATHAGAAP